LQLDLPIIGRLFTRQSKDATRTDLVLTMTPHIIRIPDITDDDMAPMWVGTQNNLSFRGLSPRIESQGGGDPFSAAIPPGPGSQGRQLAPDGEPGNYIIPEGGATQAAPRGRGVQGTAPSDPFKAPNPTPPPPPQVPQNPELGALDASPKTQPAMTTASMAQLRLAPRLSPQPASLSIKPGEEKVWNVIGMDVEGLQADNITMHYDPTALYVEDVSFGSAIVVDPKQPPIAKIDREKGLITLFSSTGKPLAFRSGGEVANIRVHGGVTGDTILVLDNPNLHNAGGVAVESAISGGRARVE